MLLKGLRVGFRKTPSAVEASGELPLFSPTADMNQSEEDEVFDREFR